MIINPYRFTAAGSGVTLPLHWWDLDDDNTWADQGTGGWANLTEENVSSVPSTTTVTTTTSTVGTVSRTVCDLGATPHRLTGGSHAWDGASNTNISMSMWAYLDAYSSTANSFFAWNNAGSVPKLANLSVYQNYSGSDDLAFGEVFDSTGDVAFNSNSPTTVNLSQWYHFVFTWDGTTLRMYQDNVEVGTGTNASVGTFSTSSMPFKIGGFTVLSNNHNGLLAMAGIWDVALSTDEIAALYASGDGANYSELWP